MKLLGTFSVGDLVEMVSHDNEGITHLKFGDIGKIAQIHSESLADIVWNNKLIPQNGWHYTPQMLRLTLKYVDKVDTIKPNQILYHGMFSSEGKNIPSDLLK